MQNECFIILCNEVILLSNINNTRVHCTLRVSDSYYEDIQKMPAISDQDMSAILKEESQVLHLFIIFTIFVNSAKEVM